MYIELSREKYEKMKGLLLEMGVIFRATDCTIPGDKEQMVHVEVGQLTPLQIKNINEAYGQDTIPVDRDGNGVSDYIEEVPELVEVRKKVTPSERSASLTAAVGTFAGKETEEVSVVYEEK